MLTAPVGTGLVSSITSDLFARLAAPYSLTNELNLTLGPQGQAFVSFLIYTTEAAPVPEPATSSLLALGLLALAIGRWQARPGARPAFRLICHQASTPSPPAAPAQIGVA